MRPHDSNGCTELAVGVWGLASAGSPQNGEDLRHRSLPLPVEVVDRRSQDALLRHTHETARLAHVCLRDLRAEAEPGDCLRHAEDRQKCTRGGEGGGIRALLVGAQLAVHVLDKFDHAVLQSRLHVLGSTDVLPDELLVEHGIRRLEPVVVRVLLADLPQVDRRHVSRQQHVALLVGLVEQQPQDVETRQQRRRQVDVLRRRLARLPPSELRVRGGQDGRARVQRGDDATLRDVHRLLLHDLVDSRAVAFVHLVELVDAADALVADHQRSSLQHGLTRVFVARDARRQTDAAASLTRREDAARADVCLPPQQLRLGHTGVAHQTDVEVAPEFQAVLLRETEPSDELAGKHLLHVFHAVDLGCQRVDELVHQALLVHLRAHRCDVVFRVRREDVLVRLLRQLDVDRLEVRPGRNRRRVHALALLRVGQEHARHLHGRAGSGHPAQAALEHNLHRPRHTPLRHVLRKLLETQLLVLRELRRPVLHVQLAAAGVRAADVRRTLRQRRVLHADDVLVHAVVARVAHVRRNRHARLHRRRRDAHACQDGQLPQVASGQLTHLLRLAGRVRRLQPHAVAADDLVRNGGDGVLPLLRHAVGILLDQVVVRVLLCGELRRVHLGLLDEAVHGAADVLDVRRGGHLDALAQPVDPLRRVLPRVAQVVEAHREHVRLAQLDRADLVHVELALHVVELLEEHGKRLLILRVPEVLLPVSRRRSRDGKRRLLHRVRHTENINHCVRRLSLSLSLSHTLPPQKDFFHRRVGERTGRCLDPSLRSSFRSSLRLI
eukprot:Rhum_TRINITY_DN14433_c38_g1::Rhum_TRINITY_DN14433_c38_g1_i1::g.91428::m.91428